MDQVSWKIIDTYFKDNPSNLVSHHLESYNDFFNDGIYRIFKDNNPIRFIERKDDKDEKNPTAPNECFLYLGGKDGTKLYYGKPTIYDKSRVHYMYPNDARLRNMTYGTTIHYDVEVEMFFTDESGERKQHKTVLEKIYLGRFPIMLQSNMCILKSLSAEIRFNMGECKNDYGGYFIIDGKEKVIIPQETFANNVLYIRKYKEDELYSHSSEIRSVSEDPSKPIRTTGVKIVSPSTTLTNNQIVVVVPNVKKPVPLFILMRALGVISDKDIIETCLLDLEKNSEYVDLFIPSVHDANKIFTQETALKYIASFTKRKTVNSALEILMNYFIPHIGTMNFLDKAHFIGYMVYRMLRVFTKEDNPTDRDNYRYKRIEQSGNLIYDLFREYYLIQKKAITKVIDTEHYFHPGKYKDNFISLIDDNFAEFFKERIVESGFKKAFKGNWGSQEHTKRMGVVQDVNRLSWNSFISQLRKTNLPLDASAKVIGPRHLNGSQWGFIDPVDTPDGGNIGLHKHLAISTYITSGFSSKPLIKWLRANTPLKLLKECDPRALSNLTKMFVNGNWIGSIDNPVKTVSILKLLRRNGIVPIYTSIYFEYKRDEIYIYTDAGRLTRPIYYMMANGNPSYSRKEWAEFLENGKVSWEKIVSGYKDKNEEFRVKNNKLYWSISDLYSSELNPDELEKYASLIEYLDSSEEEGSLIATSPEDLKKNKYFTHLEIDASLLLGVMGNMINYPEANPYARNAFSCGQSRQAVSLYHSNYQMRIDKMGVVLNCGQIPLIKSRYLEYVNKESMPYGVNAIVAIMSYTGYNVEDAILINKGAVDRGIFRTTYYSMYESREESSKVSGSTSNSFFTDVMKQPNVSGIKRGYDYSHLDKWGLIQENTELDEKMVLIGKITSSGDSNTDASVTPKKGQLGYVDKSFITEGEEGFRLAKVRIREERIPAIGDKMASRAGQKGTIGLIIPESDMPFTEDGIRPDLIINPHAIPSRMTIGQLIESLLGKACVHYGGFGDCTAFQTKGSNAKIYGSMLTKAGFHSSGNQLLYNGMTGEQLQSDIYIGPTYYMRLKHMVKDKINSRARGPITALTRQTVQGRANDGGLRIGEMERDAIISHGASHFLHESFLVRGDEYYMAVCNKTGMVAIYNKDKNLFLSPSADGPVKFHTTMDGKTNVEMVSKYGRFFSILRIPYSLKLLIQELQGMNVQMRIITEDNVDQLMNMSYSDNIIDVTEKQLNIVQPENVSDKLVDYVSRYKNVLSRLELLNPKNVKKPQVQQEDSESVGYPENVSPAYQPVDENISPAYDPGAKTPSPAYNPLYESPVYNPGADTSSSVYNPGADTPSPPFNPRSPSGSPPGTVFEPRSPSGSPPGTVFEPRSPTESPPESVKTMPQTSPGGTVYLAGVAAPPVETVSFGDEELNSFYKGLPIGSQKQIASLPQRDRALLLRNIMKKTTQNQSSILNVEEPQLEEQKEESISNNATNTDETKKEDKSSSSSSTSTSSSSGETKSVSFTV
jgi:DNA-directed RNA polymerase II subunit RPB2